MIHRLNYQNDEQFYPQLKRLLAYPNAADEQIDARVREILNSIRHAADGQVADQLLLDYTLQYDHLPQITSARALELPITHCQQVLAELPEKQKEALQQAAKRITDFHQRQKQLAWQMETADGCRLGQQITPLDRVGVYVPGGKAAYPSSVLMNALPAKIAGVGEIIMVVPTPQGDKNPLVLAAAALAGVDRVFTIGGAQAIAALTYGTATVPKVDKIVGPGNAYVASAKKQVFGQVGIDMVAGPSEILIIADGSVPAAWLAMDLFAQAEHDELAQSILISPDAAYLEAVLAAMAQMLPNMSRSKVIAQALASRGALIHVPNLSVACEIANHIAPEHLELAMADAEQWVSKIRHAGAIFIGAYSSESLGDYCAGPNHVLPTSGNARFSSPLGVYDFQKRSSIIQVSATAAVTLGKIAETIAEGEGLTAHAQAAAMRVQHLEGAK